MILHHAPILFILLTFGAATATASDPIGEMLRQAETIAERDLPAALEIFDRALAAATTDKERHDVLEARCWALAVPEPEATIAWVSELLGAGEVAGEPGSEARWRARLRVCRGYAHERAGHAAEALADYELGVEAGRSLADPSLSSRALVLRGEQRAELGRYGEAIADLKQAYDLAVALGDEGRRRYTLNAMANLYGDRHVAQPELALGYYRQLLAEHEKAGSLREMATAHFNIAGVLESQGELEAAAESYRLALELDRRRGDRAEAAVDQRALAVVLSALGRAGEALTLLDDTLAHARETGDADLEAMSRLSRGAVLRKLGRPREALVDLEKARAHYAARNNERFLAKIEDERAQALAERGAWEEAFAARGAQLAAERALAEQLVAEQTSRLRVEFETDKKEQENQTLARENELKSAALVQAERVRRLQLAVLILSLGVVASLGVLFAKQRAHARRMHDLALTDELTRLPNRRHLMALAEAAFARCWASGLPLSLVALDVDRFKRINDDYGHAVGDGVLQQIAHAVRTVLRPGDAIGRTGGEEFLVLLPGASVEQATGVAERLRATVEAIDCSALASGLRVSVSLGVAERAAGENALDSVWKRADAALYRAKSNGRNRVELAVSEHPDCKVRAHGQVSNASVSVIAGADLPSGLA